jgi:gliding motility-associated-like protein
MFIRLHFICLLFLGQFVQLSAQCNTTTCTTPVPVVNPIDACILPNPQALNCYYGGTTPDLPQVVPPNWCTDIDNNHWFAFTATSPLAFFVFTVYDCNPGGVGIQVGVYSTQDCETFQTISACTPVLPATSQTIIASALTIGQVYYICIDGIAGALCSYSINGASPAINVVGSPDVCLPVDPTSSYSTNGISTWTVVPPSAGTVVGNPVSQFVTINWNEAGPAQVCAQNVACPNAPNDCVDIVVGGGFTEQHVNLCEGKTASCGGETFTMPGIFDVVFSGANNCDSTVRCFIHLVPVDTVTQSFAVCAGDSVRCAGRYFSTAGVFPVTLQSSQACDSIVRCQITILPVDTMPVRVLNLCGPASVPICDTVYATSGVFTRTCTNTSGCDSLVTIDLAIFQPDAIIAPPTKLGCQPNASVVLNGSASAATTVTGGVTQYQWTGPGIVGAANLPFVLVNEPGQYCLVVRHGRDTFFCADTACVMVELVGTSQQSPQITGPVSICLPASSIYTATATGSVLPATFVWSTPGNLPFTLLAPDSILIVWPDTVVTGDVCVSAADSCGASAPACLTVATHLPSNTTLSLQICAGETVFAGGGLQSSSGIYRDTFQTIFGCDSILVTNLVVNAVDSLFLSQTTCDPSSAGVTVDMLQQTNGCDSIVITTTTFIPADSTLLFGTSCHPADTGVVVQQLQNAYGCDSIVITTIALVQADSFFLYATTCDPSSAGMSVQIFMDTQGCDSLVITTINLIEADTTLLSAATCDPAMTGVFTQLLSGQAGCDSVVITTVSLIEADTTLLSTSTCDPAMTGIFTQLLSGVVGCDSLVITTVSLLAADTTLLSASTCDPALAGVFTQLLSGQAGCDSVVITLVTLLPSDQVAIQRFTCDPAQTGVFTASLVNQFGCDSIVVETVSLLPSSNVTLSQTTCDPAQVGTTTQILTNQFGCDSVITTVITLSDPATCAVTATLTGGAIACGATTGAVQFEVLQGQAPFQYEVQEAGVTVASGVINAINVVQNLSGLPAGTYTLTVMAANGLSTTVQTTLVSLLPPVAIIEVETPFNGYAISCAGASDGSALVSAAGGQTPYNFVWSNGSLSDTIIGVPAGSYAVTVTDANGCTATATADVLAPEPLEFMFTVNNLGCFDNNNGAIQVNATGGTAPYRYAINGGALQPSALFSNLSAGAYTVEVVDANDCQSMEVILIDAAVPVNVDLGDNQTIVLGDNAVLQAIVNIPLDSIFAVAWTPPYNAENCPQCLEQTVAPYISTTYAIQVTALNGCTDEDRITVLVDRRKQFYVPNVFSPNDDGRNDLFSLFAKPGTVKVFKTFQIFDRWGEKVFSRQQFGADDEVAWDGTLNGKPLNPGVFVWYVEVEFVDGAVQTFKGDVTLVR